MQKIDPNANTKEKINFILGSGSPRRKELLTKIISDFDIIVSDAEELKKHSQGPISLVKENARLKASSIANTFRDSWVLGADTLVFLNDQIFGKPKNMEEAHRMLNLLSSKTHTVSTGLCLINRSEYYEECRVDSSMVTFKNLNQKTIDLYFNEVNPLDKAGAYAIQTRPDLIIEDFKGSRTNVIGLPIELLADWFFELKLFV